MFNRAVSLLSEARIAASAYSTRDQGRLAYAAALRGLRDLEARQTAQLVPYGSFRSERLSGPRDGLSEVQGGVDVKSEPGCRGAADARGFADFQSNGVIPSHTGTDDRHTCGLH
jgi:hypothetical protein